MKVGVVFGDRRLRVDNVRENEETVEGSQLYPLEALDAGQESQRSQSRSMARNKSEKEKGDIDPN